MLLVQVSTIERTGLVLYKGITLMADCYPPAQAIQSSMPGSTVKLVRNGKGFFNVRSRVKYLPVQQSVERF